MTTTTEPRERGILFSDRLVRAILDRRKTQTRRIVKRVGNDNCLPLPGRMKTHVLDAPERGLCPYGVPGDRLYVREAHCFVADGFQLTPGVAYRAGGDHGPMPWHADVRWFRGESSMFEDLTAYNVEKSDVWKWRPSIHMPKWASRIMLEITGVRVERVQDISGRDVLAEGCDNGKSNPTMGVRWENMQRMAFEELWDQTNGHRDGCSWADNPWVWVLEFRRIA